MNVQDNDRGHAVIVVWRLSDTRVILRRELGPGFWDARFDNNDDIVAFGYDNSSPNVPTRWTLLRLDRRKGYPLAARSRGTITNELSLVSVSSDGRTAYIGVGGDNAIHLFSVDTAKQLPLPDERLAHTRRAAFQPGGDSYAFVIGRELHLPGGRVVTLSSGAPNDLELSPDGSAAAVQDSSDAITVFDVATGTVLMHYADPEAQLLPFTRDGRAVVGFGRANGQVSLAFVRFDSKYLMQRLCALGADRPISSADWRAYAGFGHPKPPACGARNGN